MTAMLFVNNYQKYLVRQDQSIHKAVQAAGTQQ